MRQASLADVGYWQVNTAPLIKHAAACACWQGWNQWTAPQNTQKHISDCNNKRKQQHCWCMTGWSAQGQLKHLPSTRSVVVAGFHGRGFQEHGDWRNICAAELLAGFKNIGQRCNLFLFPPPRFLSLRLTHTRPPHLTATSSSMWSRRIRRQRHNHTNSASGDNSERKWDMETNLLFIALTTTRLPPRAVFTDMHVHPPHLRKCRLNLTTIFPTLAHTRLLFAHMFAEEEEEVKLASGWEEMGLAWLNATQSRWPIGMFNSLALFFTYCRQGMYGWIIGCIYKVHTPQLLRAGWYRTARLTVSSTGQILVLHIRRSKEC